MTFQSRIYHWLFEPHPELKDPLQRQRSAILSLVLLFVPTFYLIFELTLSAFVPQYAYFDAPQPWVLMVSILSLAIYGLTRTRYHNVTIWLTIFFGVGGIYLLHVSNATSGNTTTLYYFGVLVFAAGFICTTRQILVVISLIYACLATLLLFPTFATQENIQVALHVALFVATAALITLGSRSIIHNLQQQTAIAQQLYYGLMNAGGQAILVIDAKTYDILESNQEAHALLNSGMETIEGMSLLDFLTPDARAKISAYWGKADGVPRILTVQRPDTQILSVEARLAPHPSQEGTAYIVSLVDVTEKLLTYQALETSERRFQQVFNNLYQFMLLLDPSGIVLEANDIARRVLGLPITAIIERPIWGFNGFEEVSIKRIRQMVEEAAQGKLSRGELMFEDRHQQHRVFDCTLQPIQIESHTVELLIFSATDVTDERNMQNRLRDIERRYEALFERSQDAVFVFNTQGQIISANAQAAQFLQTSVDNIIN
ncbi:MAG: PAS domain S-box protein, partial [Anaerolineae bacterium]|nr:PAS domain S-box protein [Anaerolineae bacterium]